MFWFARPTSDTFQPSWPGFGMLRLPRPMFGISIFSTVLTDFFEKLFVQSSSDNFPFSRQLFTVFPFSRLSRPSFKKNLIVLVCIDRFRLSRPKQVCQNCVFKSVFLLSYLGFVRARLMLRLCTTCFDCARVMFPVSSTQVSTELDPCFNRARLKFWLCSTYISTALDHFFTVLDQCFDFARYWMFLNVLGLCFDFFRSFMATLWRLLFRLCRLLFRLCRLMFRLCRLMFRLCRLLFRLCRLMFRLCRLMFRHCRLMFRLCRFMCRLCRIRFRLFRLIFRLADLESDFADLRPGFKALCLNFAEFDVCCCHEFLVPDSELETLNLKPQLRPGRSIKYSIILENSIIWGLKGMQPNNDIVSELQRRLLPCHPSKIVCQLNNIYSN